MKTTTTTGMLTELNMAELLRQALKADHIAVSDFCRTVAVAQEEMESVLAGTTTARSGSLDRWAFALGKHFRVTLEPLDKLG